VSQLFISESLAHKGAVLCIRFFNGVLFSSGDDSTAKRWDKTTGILFQTYSTINVERQVSSLAFKETYLFAGTTDEAGNLLQWSIDDGSLYRSLIGSFLLSSYYYRSYQCDNLYKNIWRIFVLCEP
jgi:WD40 repeat protein